ncbi:MAG: hypothetical protein IJT83_15920 [Victivallales bacterium]|nr:hypothetical protein [Victivallales bacterium]
MKTCHRIITVLSCLFGSVLPLHGGPFANVPVYEDVPSLQQLSDSPHAFWGGTLHVSGFTEFNRGHAPKWGTEVSMAATKNALYVQLCGRVEPGSRRLSTESKRDGRVYHDECLELALAHPEAPEGEYYQFTLNTKNVLYDAYNVDSAWDSHVETAVDVQDDQWSATLRIPFADLGFERMPSRLLCNASRTTLSPEPEQSVMVRSSRNLFFGNMKEALLLRFGDDLPAGAFYVTSADDGQSIRAKALALPPEKFADFRVEILDMSGKPVGKSEGQVRFDSLQTELPIPFLKDGEYTFDILMLQAGVHHIPAYYGGGTKPNEMLKPGQEPERYMHFSWPVTVDNAPRLECSVKLKEEGRLLSVSLSARSVFCSDNAEYRLTLLDEAGKNVVRELGKMRYKDGAQLFECALDGLPERSRYQLKAQLHDSGELVAESSVKMATPPFPVWKGFASCKPDERIVPAPWIPVSLDGLTVTCWGRRYEFSPSTPVPIQIVSQNVPLLSRPCRIVSTPEIKWQMKSARKLSASRVRLEYSGSVGNDAELSAFSEITFDGTIRTDLEIPGGVGISQLYFEVDYRREIAKYLHHGPGVFGGMLTIRQCLKPESFPIIPNIMLLNDVVGLGWFDGMPFDWPLARPDDALSVMPGTETTTLRVNYIDNAEIVRQRRRFSFGLQALPARPMPEREEAMRLCYAIRYGDEQRTAWLSSVDYQPNGNIDIKQGTLEYRFLVPSLGKRDRLALVSHGDANQFSMEIDDKGILFAHTQEYWSEKWRIKSPDALKPGIWHHVACTWGNGSVELWLDGRMVDQSAQPELMRIFPANLSIGSKSCILDELRISSIKRNSFPEGEPTVDEYTLLCDNFDSQTYTNGRKATRPGKISAESECGYILPDTNIVEGIRGKAVGPLAVPTRSLIDGYAALGFQAVCYHASQYTDEAFAGLYIADEKRFRSSLEAVHKAGMKGIIYVGNGLSTIDRSWDTYADEWLIEPRMTPFISSARPYEKGYQACPRSGYIQYFFHRIGKLMDDYGIDGIFMDGRLDAQCSNPRHGCGVENFNGEKVSGRDAWRCRENAWWLYNIVQSRGGYCEQHKSGNWNIPSCFFWNGVWEGEQLMGVRLNGRKRLSIVPLEAMRGEINGIPYGMPSRNTAYSHAPLSPVENCTMSFVHGTSWTMTYRIEEGLVVSPYWLALEQFGANKRNFLGYWAKRPPAKATCDELVKVSAHVKEGCSLLIVANFNEDNERVEGEIALDLQALKIRKPRVRNAFSGQEIPVSDDGRFAIGLKSFRQDWFIVEEAR